jgi:[ribosomal protein S5]-alanine N-acetyltransferase
MQLQSERLRYEKFTPTHFDNYYRLVSKTEVMQYISGAALDPAGALDRFSVALAADRMRKDMGFLAVFEKETNEFVGLGKIVPFEEDFTEIGYALLPEFWGKGYASEITERLITYARGLGSIKSLIALVMPENIASVKVLTKHKFSFLREVPGEKSPRNDYVLYL